jgi:hypothetical protein
MRPAALVLLALLTVLPLTADAGPGTARSSQRIGDAIGSSASTGLRDRLFGRRGIEGRSVRSVRKFHARALRGTQSLEAVARNSTYTYQVTVPNDLKGGIYIRRALTALQSAAGYSRVSLNRVYKAMQVDVASYKRVVVRETPEVADSYTYAVLIPKYDATAQVLVERTGGRAATDPTYSALRL